MANTKQTHSRAATGRRGVSGRPPPVPNRARPEVQTPRQERIRLEGDAAVVSARLAQLLLLEPTVQLRPAEFAVLPVTVIAPDAPLGELVATGLLNRPELAESRSLVEASVARWRQTRLAPPLPTL